MATAITATTKSREAKHSVSWLERELAEAREDLEFAGERINATNIKMAEAGAALFQKNDQLTQALNERDMVRNERDDYYRSVIELRKDLNRLREAHTQLTETNQQNFDKACLSAVGLAVLVSCLVDVTGEAPVETMSRLLENVDRMYVSPKVIGEIQSAFKRGYAAQVERAVAIAFAETSRY